MMQTTKKYYLTFLFFWTLIFTLTSCLSCKTVIRNYEYYNQESCDCITSHPLIVVGSNSNYYSKEKATCTRTNFIMRLDSVSVLKNLKYQLEEEIDYDDSINPKIISIDSMINDLKNDWTHLKIKTKWKGSGDSLGIVILKQKIKYYNKFKPLRKYMGKVKFKNGELIKSKMKNGYNIK